jgi:hypothetical protein
LRFLHFQLLKMPRDGGAFASCAFWEEIYDVFDHLEMVPLVIDDHSPLRACRRSDLPLCVSLAPNGAAMDRRRLAF